MLKEDLFIFGYIFIGIAAILSIRIFFGPFGDIVENIGIKIEQSTSTLKCIFLTLFIRPFVYIFYFIKSIFFREEQEINALAVFGCIRPDDYIFRQQEVRRHRRNLWLLCIACICLVLVTVAVIRSLPEPAQLPRYSYWQYPNGSVVITDTQTGQRWRRLPDGRTFPIRPDQTIMVDHDADDD